MRILSCDFFKIMDELSKLKWSGLLLETKPQS